jgi:hypothetical protein
VRCTYVFGVTGGCRQREDSRDFSYVAVFGQDVQALWDIAASDEAT